MGLSLSESKRELFFSSFFFLLDSCLSPLSQLRERERSFFARLLLINRSASVDKRFCEKETFLPTLLPPPHHLLLLLLAVAYLFCLLANSSQESREQFFLSSDSNLFLFSRLPAIFVLFGCIRCTSLCCSWL